MSIEVINNNMEINPKFNDFLKKHKDISLMGMAWSCYWRLAAVIMGVYFVILLFASLG